MPPSNMSSTPNSAISMIYLTRGKRLQTEFVGNLETASTLLLYKLGDQHIPSNVSFPAATSVAVINCDRRGVFNALTPYIFPNVRTIHYLSAHPGAFNIHERFKEVMWEVPEKEYAFYDHLCRAGVGRRVPHLLSSFVTNKRIVDGVNGFDVSFHFDLRVPGLGEVDGEWYRDQTQEYLALKQTEFYREEDKELM